jgi:adenosylhomocysteine nucleosidase
VSSWKIKRSIAIALMCLTLTVARTSAQDKNQKKAKVCLTECTPRIGIVSAFGNEADILLAQTTNKSQYIINGNTFTTGQLRGNRIVIVLTGVSVENASMLTQLMIDHFNVHHLLLSGIAGGVSPDYHIGDVIIPDKWALPLEVYWNGDSNVPSPCGTPGDLSCQGLKLSEFTNFINSDYQIPTASGSIGTSQETHCVELEMGVSSKPKAKAFFLRLLTIRSRCCCS